ncbi:unnamed protein product [Fraxinus pennsylvanica]|uniref:Uncharacterized protein n=1 Tax=Fraxinus pennsylvanica TaxID=56036 RepID=A0AAD2EDH7_9LAMI|nr:unnamed protein product [Fraxinus pennsylvanica]
MSFTYATIGSALGLAKVIENGEIKGSIGGVPTSNPTKKVWAVSQALGDIAFAFPFSVIFLEIQDTLRSNPPEKVTMKKASIMAVCTTTFFNLCCGGLGYAAFGNSTPGNLLTGFGFYEPYWLIDFANACVFLHLVGGYQVFSQPLFAITERWIIKKFPNCRTLHEDYNPKLIPGLRLNLLRLCFRTAYVAFTTGFAILFPDKPGHHDFFVLKKLVLPDGSTLRAKLPGRPTRDCLFSDPTRDGKSLLKIWNMNDFTGILGVFNCQGAAWCRVSTKNLVHNEQPGAVSCTIQAKDVHI